MYGLPAAGRLRRLPAGGTPVPTPWPFPTHLGEGDVELLSGLRCWGRGETEPSRCVQPGAGAACAWQLPFAIAQLT